MEKGSRGFRKGFSYLDEKKKEVKKGQDHSREISHLRLQEYVILCVADHRFVGGDAMV